jgi:hypothetical protein
MQQYTDYDISQALQAVAAGQSVRRAALDWGVPRSTLRCRLSGTETRQIAAETQQRLSPVQEKRLVDWVLVEYLGGFCRYEDNSSISITTITSQKNILLLYVRVRVSCRLLTADDSYNMRGQLLVDGYFDQVN